MIGEGVRRVREAAGARQGDLSRVARTNGLTWSQSKIAAIERGDKPVGIEELVMLTLVLSDVCGREVTVPELIDPAVVIRLSGTKMIGGRGLALMLAGKPLESGPTTVEEALPLIDAITEPWRQATRRARALGLDVNAVEAAYPFTASGEAEEKTGRRLGEPAAVVVALSHALWGRTLTDERDRLVAERDPQASPDRRRALRGQVTRQLVDELAVEIKRRETGGDGERTEEAGR